MACRNGITWKAEITVLNWLYLQRAAFRKNSYQLSFNGNYLVVTGDRVNDIKRIISDLEQQRSSIDRAISALREVSGMGESRPAAQTQSATKSAPRKRRLSEEGRRRIAEAARKRWAAQKAATGGTPSASPKKRGRKRGATKKGPAKAATA